MDPSDLSDRLTAIKTMWTVLFQAHGAKEEGRTAARQQLLLRYYGAVYRYLLGTLRDPAAAEELTQDFAVRFLRGDFKRADPKRGRFRDFVKTALQHLARDHWRKRLKAPMPLSSDDHGQAEANSKNLDACDRPFLHHWREELLARTWEALAQAEQQSGQPYHAVLRWKVERPDLRATQLAARLAAQSPKPFSQEGVRQMLHRARKKFAELLLDEVARSLQTSDPEKLEQELTELDLLDYCRNALQRRRA
jgi:RNA polymerase sigma-70 factor (ECF subfamily)